MSEMLSETYRSHDSVCQEKEEEGQEEIKIKEERKKEPERKTKERKSSLQLPACATHQVKKCMSLWSNN